MGFTDSRKTTGAYTAQVACTRRVTPHMVRVTFTGQDLRRMPVRGFDHWLRLFLPHPDGATDFAAVPDSFGVGGYLRYLTAARGGVRPPVRSYTVRDLRPHLGEMDIDFVAHGDTGLAGRWAQSAAPGERVIAIDQGRGFDPVGLPHPADRADQVDQAHREEEVHQSPGPVGAGVSYVLACEESGLPAVAGILRDLPRTARGTALLEVPTADDAQDVEAPACFEVRWLPRPDPRARPGQEALAALRTMTLPSAGSVHAYVVGEQQLAAQGRRHLVAAGVAKEQVVFMGYWKAGRGG